MSTTNTRPEQIIDKNGKATTVHKSIDTKGASAARVATLPAPAATVTLSDEDFGSATNDSAIHYSFNDEIFETAIISRDATGKLVASGEFTIDSDSMEYLRNETDDLSQYLESHSDEIKGIVKGEYGATSVSIDLLDESITVGYELPIDDNITGDELLDAFYETRAVTLHSHANTSDKFSYAIAGLDKPEEESFQPRQTRYAFDDEN